jgi:hypothetical protein
MRRLRIVGLCIVVGMAASALVSASASAAPTYYECAKVAKGAGKYLAGCAEEAAEGAGTYEIQEGAGKGKAFKGKGAAVVIHLPSQGSEFTCKASSEEGFYTVTGQDKVKLTITGCAILGKTCQSAGAKAGEIKTSLLAGTLGYIATAGPKVGVALVGEGGSPWAEFACGTGAGSLNFVVTSGAIAEVTGDVNSFNKEVSNAYSVNGEGFQTVERFVEGPLQILEYTTNGSPLFEMGIQTTMAIKGEALEIKA